MIYMLSAITLAVLLVWIEKIIYGNIQQGDELIKSIEAGVLSSVFKIHDRARGAVYKLCEVFLCPAFGFSFALDFPAQRVKIKFSFILVHFHLTPILFYISGDII